METILIFCALQMGCSVILYFLLKRHFTKWFAQTGQIEKVRSEVEKMLVDLNHTTAGNIDLIEERLVSLREILQSVDKRITVLKRETEKTEIGSSMYSSIVKKPIEKEPVKREQETYSDIKQNIPKKKVHEEKAGSVLLEKSEIKGRVLELYNSGFSLAVIANQVGTSIGEVELIVSLTENRHQG